jgi:hypothetical protein
MSFMRSFAVPILLLGLAAVNPGHAFTSRETQLTQSTTSSDGSHDFDLLAGHWNIQNRRLKQRWVGSDEWDEFPATSAMQLTLGGIGIFDEYKAPARGFAGITLRLYQPATQQWSLYWANSRDGVLQPPVHGRFVKDVGTFYGDDVDDGKPVRVRYIWSRITRTSARWEQAFSIDGGKSWETNWIMDFTRSD